MARTRWRSSRSGEPIDLLISDVVMPGMDGPTMVREARKSRPDLKILFMSGYAEEQLRKSIDIENVNFLPKPFSVTDLAEAARRAVGAEISSLRFRVRTLCECDHAGARSILIVEDEPLIAMMLEDFLDSLGHKVRGTCDTVECALDEVEKGGFDLAILDVNLKGENVWPVATQAAREEGAVRDRDRRPRRSAAARVQRRAGDREALYGRPRHARDRGGLRGLDSAAASSRVQPSFRHVRFSEPS